MLFSFLPSLYLFSFLYFFSPFFLPLTLSRRALDASGMPRQRYLRAVVEALPSPPVSSDGARTPRRPLTPLRAALSQFCVGVWAGACEVCVCVCVDRCVCICVHCVVWVCACARPCVYVCISKGKGDCRLSHSISRSPPLPPTPPMVGTEL